MIARLLKLLPPHLRKRLLPVIGSILVSTLLDLAGIAVILPIFILLLGGGDIQKYPFLETLYTWVDPGSTRNFIYLLTAGILVVLVIKYIFSLLLLRLQTKYMLAIYRYFSEKLFKTYYNRGYLFIKENGTTDLTYKINSVCYAAATMVLQPMLSIAAEGTIALLTFVLIGVFSPFSALAILLSFIPVCVLYMSVVRGRIIRYGRIENRARNQQFRIVQETLNSFPSIQINQAFDKMHAKFNAGLQEIAGNRIKTTLLSRFPHFLMEITVILCMVLLMLTGSGNWETLSVSLAFFCAGALRILPAIRSILGSYSQIKNNNYAIETIIEALRKIPAGHPSGQNTPPLPFTRSITVHRLYFEYPDRGAVINGLSFTIQKGERLGIKGASGAGKTTLFNLLLGLYAPQAGQICIDNVVLQEDNYRPWQRLIGYVPQEVPILNASIAENVAFSVLFETHARDPLTLKEFLYNKETGCEHFPIEESIREKIETCLAQAQLLDFVRTLPDGIYTLIGENGCKISGGQKQRIGIARALFKNPEILFFDEATSALDPQMEQEVNNAITAIAAARKELTILIIAHRPGTLAMCDRIIEIK